MLVCIIFFIIHLTKIQAAFVEQFFAPNTKLWDLNNKRLQCNPDGYECVFLTQSNMRWTTFKGMGILRLRFTNFCYGNHCCSKSDYCTPYTSSALTSKKTYGYGSYRWHATASRTFLNEANATIYSCFSVETHENDEIGMSICSFSRDPSVVSIALNGGQGVETHTELFRLDFNANETNAWYRIDYQEDSIAYYIDGVLIRKLRSDEGIKIPHKQMKVDMGLFSGNEKQSRNKQTKLQNRAKVDVRMRIFQFLYKEIVPDIIVHDEPMTLGGSSGLLVWKNILRIASIVLFLFFSFWFVIRWVFRTKDAAVCSDGTDFYILIEERSSVNQGREGN